MLEGQTDTGFREDSSQEVSFVGEVQGLLSEKTMRLEGPWGSQKEATDQVLIHF